MPIDNIVYTASNSGGENLNNFVDTVIVRLRVQDAGQFLILGKVVILNDDGDFQEADARLTTLDGETELDRADVRIGPAGGSFTGAQEISLQATMFYLQTMQTQL